MQLLYAIMLMMKLARIHRKTEPIWHVQLAIGVAIAVQLLLNKSFAVGPQNLLAGIELLLLIAISIPGRKLHKHKPLVIRHLLAIILLGIITVSNILSLVLVSIDLINGSSADGHDLIFSAVVIFATNIVIFGLLYWELDEDTGDEDPDTTRDFLFHQLVLPASITKQPYWNPTFFDYLYVSITNATAFSPSDTFPLTHRAKLLMAIQSLTSLTTVVLVASRAIAILR